MDPETALAFVASSYGVAHGGLADAPDPRRSCASRDSHGVSAGYQRVLLVGFLLWLAYGIARDNWAIIIPNIVAAIVSVATIAVALHYRRP